MPPGPPPEPSHRCRGRRPGAATARITPSDDRCATCCRPPPPPAPCCLPPAVRHQPLSAVAHYLPPATCRLWAVGCRLWAAPAGPLLLPLPLPLPLPHLPPGAAASSTHDPVRWPHRDVAQLGSALRSGRRGRRFESCHPDFSFAPPPSNRAGLASGGAAGTAGLGSQGDPAWNSGRAAGLIPTRREGCSRSAAGQPAPGSAWGAEAHPWCRRRARLAQPALGSGPESRPGPGPAIGGGPGLRSPSGRPRCRSGHQLSAAPG